jgi:hypothetical protein
MQSSFSFEEDCMAILLELKSFVYILRFKYFAVKSRVGIGGLFFCNYDMVTLNIKE